jgi:hypothetical protein
MAFLPWLVALSIFFLLLEEHKGAVRVMDAGIDLVLMVIPLVGH